MRRLFYPALLLFFAACQSSDDVGRGADGTLVLGGVEQTETVERGVVPGQRSLVLTGFNGEIRLSGTDAAQAALRFVKKGRGDNADDAREALGDIHLAEAGDDAAYRYTASSENPSRTSVDVEGTVPRGTRLEITLANGAVVVREMEAALVVRVQSGSVQVAAARGGVDVEMQNGDAVVGLARVREGAAVRLVTQNGRLVLGLPPDAGARLEASSEVGAIRAGDVQFRSQRLEPKGAGARFEATMGSGAARITLETQNGDIELRNADALTVISATPADTVGARR